MTTFPAVAAGQRITAALLTSMLPSYTLVTATQTVNNSATLVNDSDLAVAVAANATYEWELHASWQTAVNCDLKTAWTFPAGTTGLKHALGATGTAGGFTDRTNTSARVSAHVLTTVVAYQIDIAGTDQWIHEWGVAVTSTTAGTLQFQWAQNTATVGDLIRAVTTGYIKLRQVA